MASRGLAKDVCAPFRSIVPDVGWWTPVMTLIRVDFPAPFSPRRAWMEPGISDMPTPFRAMTPGNAFSTLRASRIGVWVISCRSLAHRLTRTQPVQPDRRQNHHAQHDLNEERVDREQHQ